jgi:GT2 family glycosyltransferase
MSEMIVSVIIPTYRRPKQLQKCLEALAQQTLTSPWEVIVVDDGSPEPPCYDTECLLAERGWRLLKQANSGPSSARNLGAQNALGKFIAFTDDDCLPEANWLEELLKVVTEWPTALAGGTTVNGLKDDFFASTSQMIVDMVYEHFNSDLCNSYFLASNNIICSRLSFLEIGGFDGSFKRAGAEDRDFCDRWRMANLPIVWHPKARIEHRHAQTFFKFLDLYVRYGRGAYRYQAMRKQRGSGTLLAYMSFHRSLPRRIWLNLKKQNNLLCGCATFAALIAWQIANAAGFIFEALATSLPAYNLQQDNQHL